MGRRQLKMLLKTAPKSDCTQPLQSARKGGGPGRSPMQTESLLKTCAVGARSFWIFSPPLGKTTTFCPSYLPKPRQSPLAAPVTAPHPPSSSQQQPGLLSRPHPIPCITLQTCLNRLLGLKTTFPRDWIVWLGIGPMQLCLKAPEAILISHQGWEPLF